MKSYHMHGVPSCLLLLGLLAVSQLRSVHCIDFRTKTGTHGKNGNSKHECTRECHELHCDTVGLRYGKYCGVGHGGCEGEEPCDEVDACCKLHDDCVGEKNVLANDCHADFLACLDQAVLAGGKGFSKECPWSVVVPTMKNGIELTMMFSGFLEQHQ